MNTRNAPWWIALFAWMGLSTYWHVCEVKELCDAPLNTLSKSDAPANPLLIMDGNKLSLQSNGNVAFAKSGAEANINSVRTELDSLANYLKMKPTKRLTIVGQYTSTETNSTAYPDLGIARAESIKQYLVNKGLPDSVLITTSNLMESLEFKPDSMQGGIDFAFNNVIPTTVEGLANAETFESVFKPMDLYFPSGSSDFIKTDANKKFLEEAKKYLSENPDKKLSLTGHTDSDGNEASNLRLSKTRAEEVKKQFVRTGIGANQLATDGKGETEPKESNDTPTGKQANRRVTIIVQ